MLRHLVPVPASSPSQQPFSWRALWDFGDTQRLTLSQRLGDKHLFPSPYCLPQTGRMFTGINITSPTWFTTDTLLWFSVFPFRIRPLKHPGSSLNAAFFSAPAQFSRESHNQSIYMINKERVAFSLNVPSVVCFGKALPFYSEVTLPTRPTPHLL